MAICVSNIWLKQEFCPGFFYFLEWAPGYREDVGNFGEASKHIPVGNNVL